MANPELLEKVEGYLLDDEEFVEEFETFAHEHCDIFDESIDENKLEYTEIYNRFTALFEERIESAIRKFGSTPEQFAAACDKADEESFVVPLILSITSFDQFRRLMLDEKKKKSKSAA